MINKDPNGFLVTAIATIASGSGLDLEGTDRMADHDSDCDADRMTMGPLIARNDRQDTGDPLLSLLCKRATVGVGRPG